MPIENAEDEAQRLRDWHSGNEMDVIYYNMNVTCDFRTTCWQGFRTVDGQMQRLNRKIEAGCFDKQISVALFCLCNGYHAVEGRAEVTRIDQLKQVQSCADASP